MMRIKVVAIAVPTRGAPVPFVCAFVCTGVPSRLIFLLHFAAEDLLNSDVLQGSFEKRY